VPGRLALGHSGRRDIRHWAVIENEPSRARQHAASGKFHVTFHARHSAAAANSVQRRCCRDHGRNKMCRDGASLRHRKLRRGPAVLAIRTPDDARDRSDVHPQKRAKPYAAIVGGWQAKHDACYFSKLPEPPGMTVYSAASMVYEGIRAANLMLKSPVRGRKQSRGAD
jgi:hypothetical protein